MTRSVLLAWVLAAVWAAWLCSAQGALAAQLRSPWVPDLALVFLLSLGARIPREDLPKAGLAVALARCAVSIDPPVAILAAYLGLVALLRAVRGVVDVTGPVPRALLAGVGALSVQVWLAGVHELRLEAELARAAEHAPQAASLANLLVPALPSALCTALLALVAGSYLAWFPGLSLLVRRRAWRVVASSR